MKMLNFVIIMTLTFTTGCAFFTDRSFIEKMEDEPEGFWVGGRDFRVVGGDTGRVFRTRSEIYNRTPGSSNKLKGFRLKSSLREELADLEEKQSPDQWDVYAEHQKYLKTLSERIYYLKLQGVTLRQEYIFAKGSGSSYVSQYHTYGEEIRVAITGRGLILGMTKNQVIQSWGRPMRVDVAGNPRHENERWTFLERGKLKQVYFEQGKVQGWKDE